MLDMIAGPALRWVLVGALISIVILVPFVLLDREVTSWSLRWMAAEARGSWMVAAVLTLLAADIVLPVPSSLVSTAAGASLGFMLGAVTSTAGMTLCSELGYLLGRWMGLPIVGRIVPKEALDIASDRLGGRATGALVIMRAVPVLAEASVVMAGVLRVNPTRFLVTTLFANIGISIAYCAVGALAFEVNSFIPAFAGAIAVPGVTFAAIRWYHGRPHHA